MNSRNYSFQNHHISENFIDDDEEIYEEDLDLDDDDFDNLDLDDDDFKEFDIPAGSDIPGIENDELYPNDDFELYDEDDEF